MAGLAMSILAQVLFGAGHDTPSSEVRIRRLVSQAHERVAMGEGVGFVARSLGVSYPTLHRHFHRLLGLAPKEFAGKVRLARAEKLLLGGAHNIKEIASLLGFHSAAHFSAAFKKNHGVSPKSWCAARQ
jgi:AraC-like DNA-binding protein